MYHDHEFDEGDEISKRNSDSAWIIIKAAQLFIVYCIAVGVAKLLGWA